MIRELLDSRSVWRRLIYPIRPHMGLMSLVVIFEILRQVSGMLAVLGAALFAQAVASTPGSLSLCCCYDHPRPGQGPLVIWAPIYLMWQHSASRRSA